MEIIIFLSLLILLAYFFDITSKKTKIPTVILLLLLGFFVRIILDFLNINIPKLDVVLPILGTIGLILIVLEGALELEINHTKVKLILTSIFVAIVPIFVLSFSLSYIISDFFQVSFKYILINIIPLSIISSAIAIPSSSSLLKKDKEFVTYESSISDIIGVMFFNFVTLNDNIGTKTFIGFSLDLFIIIIASFALTIFLVVFLNKINHHIKFIPILIFIIFLYSLSKIVHLPGLIFILILGLFLGNLKELKNIKFVNNLNTLNFQKDLAHFRSITSEVAFLIRAMFFILFGFLLEQKDLLNFETMYLSFLITVSIFFIRFLVLKLFFKNIFPLFFIAPRGLITILLFLSIPKVFEIELINKSLIIQVIILTTLFMMFGMMIYKKPPTDESNKAF
jgi:cell volume regulation protein A